MNPERNEIANYLIRVRLRLQARAEVRHFVDLLPNDGLQRFQEDLLHWGDALHGNIGPTCLAESSDQWGTSEMLPFEDDWAA
jgi:hypothetical protein